MSRLSRRLLSVSHSYSVALNRRLADEMARAGGWDVTAVAPSRFHGEFRTIDLEPAAGEACRVEAVPAHLTRRVPLMLYGRRLRDILRQPWDIVHCWEEPFVLAAGQVVRWTPSSSGLVFASFQNLQKRYPPPFRWIERRAMARADGWIAFGRTIEDALAPKACYAARPHRVIPPGVDTTRFRPDRAAGVEVRRALGWEADDRPVLGYLGRFVPEKGLGLLTRALDRLGGPWRALLVGGGPMEEDLRAWAATKRGNVAIVTGVAHGAVPRHLNAMDLLCAPSQTTERWREQFGRMIIEAFACGVPVIGSDSGEIPFVIGEAGVVVPEADEAAWTAAIESLAADPARRADLAARGLARVDAVYAWPRVARSHLAFFEELLVSRGGVTAGRP
jgi:glycosyltransferase involved in cell wall biosynthesis